MKLIRGGSKLEGKMFMNRRKVLIVGLMKDTNLGEDVYPKCMSYVLKNEAGQELTTDFLDLYGRAGLTEKNTCTSKDKELLYSKNCNVLQKVIIKAMRVVRGHCSNIFIKEWCKDVIWKVNPNDRKRLEKVYAERMAGCDAAIFAGGGIIECSLQHDYYHHLDLFTSIADDLGVSVCFNSVGAVNDLRCKYGLKFMQRALTRKCVKFFSCRDEEEYINQTFLTEEVSATTTPCCAVFSKDAFKPVCANKECIGIGVIRGNVYTSYGNKYSEEQLLMLYKQIIEKLEKRGDKCILFTNGYSKDIVFAKKLAQSLGRNEDFILERANTAEELVNQINSFKGIITARLHSTIVAYSLDVPFVVLSWNKKVSDFAKLIGDSNLAIQLDQMNADYVIEQYDRISATGFDDSVKQEIQNSSLNGIRSIVQATLK